MPVSPESSYSLIKLVTASTNSVDILQCLKTKYAEDPFFRVSLEKRKDYWNFEITDDLVYLKVGPKHLLCISKVLVNGWSTQEIVIFEAHSLLTHLGASKTVAHLKDQVWWRDMVTDIKSFHKTCVTCKRSKPSNQKMYGLLNPLPVPGHPWESIGINYIGPLPESSNQDGMFDGITVVICLLTALDTQSNQLQC